MKRQILISAVSIFIFVQIAGIWIAESYAAEKPGLKFQLKSGPKMFDIDDIVRFDWDQQVFELTRQSAMDFMTKLTGLDSQFEVQLGNDIVYSGSLVSWVSSITYTHPVIMFPESIGGLKPPLFEIDAAYPEGFAKEDLRFSERLKKSMEQARVLGEIDVNNPPPPIQRITHGCFGEKEGLRVLVEVFPETFRLRELARAHLNLTGGNYLSTSAYVVDVNTTLVANKGKFMYSTKRIFPAHEDGWKNIYIMGMNPWVSVEDSIDKIAKPGPAEISFDICLRKIIDEDKSLYSEPIESLKTGPINVVILPQERNELPEEAKAVMIEFQEALKDSDWNKALSYCSQNVQKKAKGYQAQKAFFDNIVPVDKLIEISEFPIWHTESDRLGYKLFGCFLQLSPAEAKPTISWEWNLSKTDTGWVVDFKTIPLDSWIEQEKLRLSREHEKARERDRTLQEGLKLSLVPLSDGFVIGQPMLFRLEMTNISGSPIAYKKTSFLMINNHIIVIAPSGERLEYIYPYVQTMSGPPVNIEPNQTVVLVEKYDATTQYHIIQPGQYTFQFTGHWGLKSNIVKMDIKPGEPFSEDTIVGNLLSVLPKDWTLTRTRIRDIADFDSETDRGIVVNMVGKRGRKGTPGGTVGVLILINPSQSVLEKTEHEAELWGQSQWGPVYVKSLNAELLWPDYKEQIINALDIQRVDDKADAQIEIDKR
ncbi:MAG: hypothetical protein IIC00_07925 [Planctomycetes bacterium]|nr:hypothetical protein [Planctomycetota bacterium]